MVSEDSGCLLPMDPPVPTASVHGDGSAPEPSEPLLIQVLAFAHRSNDVAEGLELPLLAAEERLPFEEGDHLVNEIRPVPNHEHEGRVA